MGDIRDDLNARRNELKKYFAKDRKQVDFTRSNGSAYYEMAARNIAELRSIESTLATMQLADAQQRATEAQMAAIAESEKARGISDDFRFWWRRLLTTLSVANAAAAVAVLSFMLQSESPFVPAHDVITALRAFGLGAALGALFPLVQMAAIGMSSRVSRHTKLMRLLADWLYPAFCAVAFCTGMALVTGAAIGYINARFV